MNKLVFAIIIILTTVSSCKKDSTCVCTTSTPTYDDDNTNTWSNIITTSTYKMTGSNKSRIAQCKALQDTGVGTNPVTVSCAIETK